MPHLPLDIASGAFFCVMNYQNEQDYRNAWERVLSIFFYLEKEVKKGKSRIDLIATHKINGLQFGIEFKQSKRWKGAEMGKYLMQAVRYAHVYKMPIILAPEISGKLLDECFTKTDDDGKEIAFKRATSNYHHTVNGLLATFGIGELRKLYDDENKSIGACFLFNNKLLWKVSKYKDGLTEEYEFYQKNYEKTMNTIDRNLYIWKNIFNG